MPRGKPSKTDVKAEFKGYVNVTMTEEQRDKCKALYKETESDALFDRFQALVEGGYKVSVSWDSYNEAFTASLMCLKPAHPDVGYCLTGRGNDVLGAVVVLFYKHFVILEQQWLKNQGRVQTKGAEF